MLCTSRKLFYFYLSCRLQGKLLSVRSSIFWLIEFSDWPQRKRSMEWQPYSNKVLHCALPQGRRKAGEGRASSFVVSMTLVEIELNDLLRSLTLPTRFLRPCPLNMLKTSHNRCLASKWMGSYIGNAFLFHALRTQFQNEATVFFSSKLLFDQSLLSNSSARHIWHIWVDKDL